MLRLIHALPVLAISVCALASCALDDPAKDRTPPPLTGGKADALGTEFVFAGALTAGDRLPGDLTATERLLGFTFYGRAGDRIALTLDSDTELDTVLFLYGPLTGDTWGYSPVAYNDDAKGSLLSRVEDVELPGDGQYLAIVQSYKQWYSGQFEIALDCSSCSTAPRAGDFRITEVHPRPDLEQGDANGDGVVDAAGDQFLEIRNLSRIPLTAEGLEIVRLGDPEPVHALQAEELIPPGQAIVVFGGAPGESLGFGGAYIEVAVLDLGELRDSLALAFDGEVIDELSYALDLPPTGSLIRQDDSEMLVPHIDVTSGMSPFSPGTAPDGTPYPNPNTSTRVPLPDAAIDSLRSQIQSELSRRFGLDIEVTVNQKAFLGPGVDDKRAAATLRGTLDLLPQIEHPDFARFEKIAFSVGDSREPSYAPKLMLDLRDDPRSYLLLVSASPDEEPLLAAFRAEADARFAAELPLVHALEARLIEWLADYQQSPSSFLQQVEGLSVSEVERESRRYGDNDQYRQDTVRIRLSTHYPDEITVRVSFKRDSDEVSGFSVNCRESSRPILRQTVRSTSFAADRTLQRAQSYIHDQATGRLLYRSFADGVGNVHRVVEVNPAMLPRESIPYDSILGNDPVLAMLQALQGGRQSVAIGIFDSGVDYNHPALAHRLAENDAEGFEADGVDDDGNGRVDDFIGWDFDDDDRLPYDYNDYLLNLAQVYDHGTHVAGIASQGTDDIRVLPARFKASKEPLAEGAGYLRQSGARVVNMSFGGTSDYTYGRLGEAIAASPQVLFVAAAGNDGRDIDEKAQYPATYPHDNILAVAAVDDKGELTSWSNFGAESVDIAAPGDAIFNAVAGGQYGLKSGTSMATPYVVNAAAKILLLNPALTAAQVRETILETGDERADLADKVACGCVVNRDRALRVAYLTTIPDTTIDEAAATLGIDTAEAARLIGIAERVRD